MSSLLEDMKRNPFFLAPMAGITDVSFRSFMREMGAGVLTSELVSSNGLEYSSQRTQVLMRFEDFQRPVGIQLFGESPEILANAAKYVQDQGADFVDLNFGCPVPKVVKKGGGSAVLRDLIQLRKVLRAVKAAVEIPLTIKIRTGWDQGSRNAVEVCRIAQEEGITWVAIHGRTRAQGYSGQADWGYISEVAKSVEIPVIGNGDILTPLEANERLKNSGCAGVMIGRGSLKNPWIFQEAMAILEGREAVLHKDYSQVFERLHFHLSRYHDDVRVVLHLKKFSAWFSAGYRNSSGFRRDIFKLKNLDEVLEAIGVYYSSIHEDVQADTRNDGFLMGGHG